MSTELRAKQVVAGCLKLTLDDIGADTTSDNVDAWDSIAHVELIFELESEFDVEFSSEETEEMLSFSEILETVRSKIDKD